jgi:hypothetical protein
MRKLDRVGEGSAACGGIELAEDAIFSLSRPLATHLSGTSAQTSSGEWQQATRKLREVVRRIDSRNSRPTA